MNNNSPRRARSSPLPAAHRSGANLIGCQARLPNTRLLPIVLLALLVCLPSTPTRSAEVSTSARSPNIVLFIADDLGYGELGCQGNAQIPTPFIDQLAASGVRCTQFYVTAPNCSPSRAGLLTGRFPTRFGYEFNPIGAINEEPGVGLPGEETTMAEYLQGAGYTTALIGKWHLGGTAPFHPQRQGFDLFYGFLHEGHYYCPPPYAGVTTMLRRRVLPDGKRGRYFITRDLLYSDHMGHDEPDYDADNPVLRSSQPVDEKDYLTDAIARESVAFIERYRSVPFFLCVSFNAVHSPLQGKQETMARLEHIEDLHRRIFAAMLVDLDAAVGRIVQCIEDQGLRRDTLFIFLSDNGGPTAELTSSNQPLRGGKGSMYEGGIRVPCIFNWHEQLPAGTVCTDVVGAVDILPTLARRVGGPPPRSSDGIDIWPALLGQGLSSQRPPLYWRQGMRAALRVGDWKIVLHRRRQRNAGPAEVPAEHWELFHLANDAAEQTDLADEHPQQLQQLLGVWRALDAEMQEPIF
ncbi:MAG: N-acetylgalactosamine-6-sulfatase [Pirellulaceae bacterium]|nr:MAG: N-acetylgalactosamine-6-sulfatase [Pirellulaceae bacterium]